MRILFPIHVWHPEGRGGSEVHARAVAMALSEQGHTVGVFARTGRAGRDEYEVTTERDGPVGVTRINNTWRDNWTFEWIYRNRRVHEAFIRELDEFRPDLVHIHHLTGLSTTIIEEVKRRKLPLLMTLHDFWTFCPRGQRITKDLTLCERIDRDRCWSCLGGMWPHIFGDRTQERTVVDRTGSLAPATLAEWDRHMAYLMGLCDLLVTPSEFHRERMLDFRLDPARMVALPHGLPAAPEQPPRDPRAPVRRIAYIGAVIPSKGVHVLIRAFRLLERPDLELHVHGEIAAHHDDTGYEARLRQAMGDATNVFLHGAYEPSRVHEILAGKDILVVPSLWWETYCLTIREGLQAGIPVVASDLGAMREALDGEEDGLLFEAGNPKDLRRVLERLIADPELRARYADRAASVPRLDAYIPRLLEVYQRATAIAAERGPDLVVAPAAFPAESPASVPLAFDRVAVAVRQDGGLALGVNTRPATQGDPSVGLEIDVAAAGKSVGRIAVDVDLRGLVASIPAKVPGPPEKKAAPPPEESESEARISERKGGAIHGSAARFVRSHRGQRTTISRRVVRPGGLRPKRWTPADRPPTTRFDVPDGDVATTTRPPPPAEES